MLAWMGYAMLASAALGATGWLIDFAVAGRLGRRRLLWAVVLLASAVGPIGVSAIRGVRTTVGAATSVAAPTASGREEPIVSDRVLGSAWLAASAVVALALVATRRRLGRRLRRCPSRIVDGERVLVSSDFGPAVVGVVRPRIVLPEWALAMRDTDRRIIVAHETEHRQARDPLLAAVALVAVAALPWNAPLWWQLRRLRLAIEIDCDRRVVSRHGHDPHAYGTLLLAAREHACGATPALAMAATRSGLGRRIEALVDGRPRPAMRRLGAVAAAVVLAAGILAVPAPRLSMVRAAVVDASAAAAPLASSTAPAAAPPPAPRQAPTPSDPSDAGRRPSAAASPSGGNTTGGVRGPTIRVIGSSIRVILPGPARTSARSDSSRRERRLTETTGERHGARIGSASTLEGRWVTMSAGPNGRVVRSRAAPNRWMLLPAPDSLRPLPP